MWCQGIGPWISDDAVKGFGVIVPLGVPLARNPYMALKRLMNNRLIESHSSWVCGRDQKSVHVVLDVLCIICVGPTGILSSLGAGSVEDSCVNEPRAVLAS